MASQSVSMTYFCLVDYDKVLDRIWNKHYKPKSDRRKPVAKDESKIPQSAIDLMRIMYDLINEEIKKGETRHLLGLQKTADEIDATKQRVRDAISRGLSRQVLALAEQQPAYGKRYIVPDDLIEERTVKIDSVEDLQQYVRSTTGSTDLFWKAYVRVREHHKRASVPRMMEALRDLAE